MARGVDGDGASEPSLREAHTADTRRRIVEALGALLVEEHPAALSMPAVARRAGVSVATLYRYFPTKEALLESGSFLATEVADQAPDLLSIATPADLEPFFLSGARSVERTGPLLRAQLASPVGRDIRRRRLPRRLQAVRRALEHQGIDVDEPDGERLMHLIVAFCSSASMLELLDRHGRTPEQVAEDLTWAALAMAKVTRQEQQRRKKPITTRRTR